MLQGQRNPGRVSIHTRLEVLPIGADDRSDGAEEGSKRQARRLGRQ